MVVGLNPHLIVPTLTTTVGPHKETPTDSSANRLMRSLLFRLSLPPCPHPVGVDTFLFLVVCALSGAFAVAALSLQTVFLSHILIEGLKREIQLASCAVF